MTVKYRESVERVPPDVQRDKEAFRAWLEARNVMFWTTISADPLTRTLVIRMYHYPHRPGTAPTEAG